MQLDMDLDMALTSRSDPNITMTLTSTAGLSVLHVFWSLNTNLDSHD